MGVSQTFCTGWPQTTVLLTSTSQVARIAQCLHFVSVTLHYDHVLVFASLVAHK
jgi:hypothetical protein